MSTRELLSIVMPAFNEREGIQKAIRTLIATVQPLGIPVEIVVVDDGSRDDTWGRAAALTAAGLPVRAFRLSRNFWQGVRAARGPARGARHRGHHHRRGPAASPGAHSRHGRRVAGGREGGSRREAHARR